MWAPLSTVCDGGRCNLSGTNALGPSSFYGLKQDMGWENRLPVPCDVSGGTKALRMLEIEESLKQSEARVSRWETQQVSESVHPSVVLQKTFQSVLENAFSCSIKVSPVISCSFLLGARKPPVL